MGRNSLSTDLEKNVEKYSNIFPMGEQQYEMRISAYVHCEELPHKIIKAFNNRYENVLAELGLYYIPIDPPTYIMTITFYEGTNEEAIDYVYKLMALYGFYDIGFTFRRSKVSNLVERLLYNHIIPKYGRISSTYCTLAADEDED